MAPEDQFAAGKDALARKDLEQARALLQPLAEAGDPPSSRFFLARCAFLEGNYSDAQHWNGILRERQPKHAGALVLEGRIFAKLAQYDNAEASIEKALELDPELATAHAAQEEINSLRAKTEVAELIDIIDEEYLTARMTGEPSARLKRAATKLSKAPVTQSWNHNVIEAKAAYFRFAEDPVAALANYDRHLIEVSCELDYVTWPKRIQDHVRHKKVLDVGCGFGGFGMGFLVAGAKAYAGLDPVMDLASTRAKNKRTRKWSDMGVTPLQIMKDLPAIRLYQGTAESITFEETFDTIALHNVTEHLIQLETVLSGLVPLCEPDTRVVYLHHNYYCWNGHHFAPNQPHKYDPVNPEHQKVVDWRHIDIVDELADDHYFKTHLNRVTLTEIRDITERHFEIEVWDELPSNQATVDRLTDDVRARVAKVRPDLEDRDLLTNVVFCVARSKER